MLKRPVAKFCTLKCSDLKDVVEAMREGYVSFDRYEVVETVKLTPHEFDDLINNLMHDRSYLKGKGGCDSDTPPQTDKPWTHWGKEEWEEFRRGVYRLVVKVTDGKREILVDPEGYSYARYVGFHDESLAPL